MLSRDRKLKKFEIDGENLSVSIAFDTVITDDVDGEISRTRHRRAFTKDEGIAAIKEYTEIQNNQNPYLVLLRALWT